MSKAVLVMNMPENCYQCRLTHRLNPEEIIDCRGRILSDTYVIFKNRPNWCPLRELPEEKESDPVMDHDIDFGSAIGWNACLEAITRESEEKEIQSMRRTYQGTDGTRRMEKDRGGRKMIGTGKFDKDNREMQVGDIVHFRASGISGKGIVYLADKPDFLAEDLFRIRDTREGKNFGRVYPYYLDATYTTDRKADERSAEKTDLIIKIMRDSSVTNNRGNYQIPVLRVIEIIQEA